MKYLKYILVIWLLVTLFICVGGIIKYNIDLKTYIDQKEPKASMHHVDTVRHGTEVYLLGAVHFETNKIKRDDLYHYIDSISPSVILYESDAKTVQRMLNRTDFFRQLMSTFKKGNKVESFVSLKYLEYHPECEILSYEWEERDSYHRKYDVLSKSSEMLNAVIKLHREQVLTSDQSATLEEFLALNKKVSAIGRGATLHDINNSTTDSILGGRQMYVYKYIPEIVKQRQELQAYHDFVPRHMEYWDIRNRAMAQNIIKQIKRNPNKRIVVLNGYYHRYYLIDKLKKHEEDLSFSVK